MKRLWVEPHFRKAGVGRALVQRVIEAAERNNFALMRLDTLEGLVAARRLYEDVFGFYDLTLPYYHNPLPNVVFYERAIVHRRAHDLLIFDFDYSLYTADNSDTQIVEHLGSPQLVERRKQLYEQFEEQWTPMMNEYMRLLHEECKVSGDQIVRFFEEAQGIPRVLEELLAELHTRNTTEGEPYVDMRILSDSNSVFIDAALRRALPGSSSGVTLGDVFEEVVTNPASFDEAGRLHVRALDYLHSCERCPPNLCKGVETRRMMLEQRQRTGKVVYVGDGGGDLCGVLQLGDNDVVLARKDWALHKKAAKAKLRATMHTWEDAEELAAHIRRALSGR